ncbi:MAG: hypothetical protein E4H26_08055 [Flavobacteriales bacterium]|nr:MAG: hypothetical protein E4H26_08055 [Flavobacteriales bacterium]
MRRQYISVISLLVIILWSSCRKDFEYDPSNGNLSFSKDTVFLDTIFTNIGSGTYALTVYNRTGIDLEIPSIRLGQGPLSNYRLNVDGMPGKEFQGIPIRARDSLFIFIETTFDISQANGPTFLYTDAILFDSGFNLQEVALVTLVKDAIFLFPRADSSGQKETLNLGPDGNGNEIRVEGFTLGPDQLDFTNEKPYVIYGYAAVPENATLVMEAGTRVHFHQNSGIWVQPSASLQINGALSTDTLLLEKEVIFEGDRLEPEFDNIPGQWGTLWMARGSVNNRIDHLTLKNATVGLLVEGDGTLETPTLTIRNSQIYDAVSVNLWAKTAWVDAENLVLGSAGSISLYCNLGGKYAFVHSTIANYWNRGLRNGAAVQIDNQTNLPSGELAVGNLEEANFVNSIIDGNGMFELELISNQTNTFNFSFQNCLIKINDQAAGVSGNPLYDFQDPALYAEVLLNQSARFTDTAKNDFSLGPDSPVLGAAQEAAALSVPFDILGYDRTLMPDMGAYQFISND